MPEEIVTRILRLPGYGVITWEADDTARTLTLWVRQTGGEPAYICGGCGGITRRDIHSSTSVAARARSATRSAPPARACW